MSSLRRGRLLCCQVCAKNIEFQTDGMNMLLSCSKNHQSLYPGEYVNVVNSCRHFFGIIKSIHRISELSIHRIFCPWIVGLIYHSEFRTIRT